MPGTSLDQKRSLHEDFYFDFSGHELIDPREERGEVIRVQEAGFVEAFGSTVPVSEIVVRDPYVYADTDGYTAVRDHISRMEARIQSDGFNPLTERAQKYPYSVEEGPSGPAGTNRYTSAWLSQDSLQPLKAWHSLVPSAVALDHLTSPRVDELITPKNPEDGRQTSTPETTAFLRFVDDAVAIRNRAVAMQSIAEDHLRTVITNKPTAGTDGVAWLSLASGTAEPSIRAIRAVQDVEDAADIDLTVVDYDGRALKKVKGHAENNGLDASTTTIQTNILDPKLGDILLSEAGKKEFTVVENLGFEEYLPERVLDDELGGDELGMFRDEDSGLPNASEFTRNAFDLVAPGGVLISGNMVLDRPQIGFVFGIVDWPLINARSEESIMRVYKRAGILDDPMAEVELFRVRDEVSGAHVYDIVKVRKLEKPRIPVLPPEALGL